MAEEIKPEGLQDWIKQRKKEADLSPHSGRILREVVDEIGPDAIHINKARHLGGKASGEIRHAKADKLDRLIIVQATYLLAVGYEKHEISSRLERSSIFAKKLQKEGFGPVLADRIRRTLRKMGMK